MNSNLDNIEQFLLTDAAACKVLVVGDVMLDIYYFGDVQRISPEAPVPVVKVAKELKTLGGAGNVANNLIELGCQVILAGVTGEDDNGQQLKGLMAVERIDCTKMIKTSRPTITKTRIVAGHQQVVRLDFEEVMPLSQQEETLLLTRVLHALSQGVAIVIVSDYGKGVCTPKVCQTIINECRKLAITTIVDPKGQEWCKYQGADFITPNIKELGDALACRVENTNEEVGQSAVEARRNFGIKTILVTRAEQGMSLINHTGIVHIPTRAQDVFDVSGAGDTVAATLGVMLAGGKDILTAVKVANIAAGVVVGKIGTSPVKADELLEALRYTGGEFYGNHKILSLVKGKIVVNKWREKGLKIAFIQGAFTLLNPEIMCILEQAKKDSGKLLIGIEESQALAKGKMMAALEWVDGVFMIEKTGMDELLNLLCPDVVIHL